MKDNTWAVTCLTLCLLVIVDWTSDQAQAPPVQRKLSDKEKLELTENFIHVEQVAHFGFENPGVMIELVKTFRASDPIEGSERLRLVDGKQATILDNIHQLRGHVQIQNEQMALRFVRMLTSPETWYLWRDGRREVEVLDAKGVSEVLTPAFGNVASVLQSSGALAYWRYDPKTGNFEHVTFNKHAPFVTLATANHPDVSSYGGGLWGTLSHASFRAAGFTPPRVRRVVGGYEITRWTLVDQSNRVRRDTRIKQIREMVGEDGAYKRTVAQQKATPDLLGIHWHIPVFE